MTTHDAAFSVMKIFGVMIRYKSAKALSRTRFANFVLSYLNHFENFFMAHISWYCIDCIDCIDSEHKKTLKAF